MTAFKQSFYIALAFSLWVWAMTMDHNAALTTEKMTLEQVEAIALDRTRTLVACAQGRDVIVGDMLIPCKPIPIPVWERK